MFQRRRKNLIALITCMTFIHASNVQAFDIPGIGIPINLPLPIEKKVTDILGNPGAGSNGSVLTNLLSCGIGAVASIEAVKGLASMNAKKQGLSEKAIAARQKQYMLGLALAGCQLGTAISNNIVAKLSEQAKQKRQEVYLEALNQEASIRQSGKPPSNRDYEWCAPDNATTCGTIKIVSYEKSKGVTCITTEEDIKVDGEKAQPLTKMCNTPPSPEWHVATA